MNCCLRRSLQLAAAAVLVAASAAAISTVALAQGAPTQATLSSLTATGGHGTYGIGVQGSIDPNGSDTRYVIDYGTSPSFEHTTPSVDIGTTPAGGIGAWIGPLSPGTVYYVRIAGTNSYGTGYSATMSARTQSSPSKALAADELVASTIARPGRYAALSSVSCPSRSLCFALGAFDGGGFLERWTGHTWRRVAVHQGAAPLGGISCTSRSFCLTVGGTGSRTLAQRWNGRAFSTVGTVSPAGPGLDLLNSVSCVSARDCWAVGATHAAENTPPSALIEHWNGQRFTLASAPSVHSYLLSVSCAGARDCWAVGSLNVTEHFDGHRWRVLRLPAAFNPYIPPGLSCRAITQCWIVGQGKASPPRGPSMVALLLVDGSWHSVPIPYGPREASNFISGVDCASSSDCWAVGQSVVTRGPKSPETNTPLAEEWDGVTWRIAKVVGRPGRNSSFDAVACASTSQCVAVGTTANGGPGSSPMVAVSEPAS
jgi:hypothetical protein